MYDLPTYVWALVLIGVIGIPASTCVVLYRGAVRAGLGRRTAAAVGAVAAAALGGWLLLSSALAYAGVYRQQPGELRPWLGLAFVGVLAGLLLAGRVPVVSRVLADRTTQARLVLPHTLRIVGLAFLILMVQGHLPAVFALPAGLGDIATGVAAPFVARRLTREPHRARAAWFHAFGLLDLVVAVSIGFLSGLGPFRPLDVTPSTEPLSLFPLALVATVAVPLAITLHIVSLRRLRTVTRPEDRTEPLLVAAG